MVLPSEWRTVSPPSGAADTTSNSRTTSVPAGELVPLISILPWTALCVDLRTTAVREVPADKLLAIVLSRISQITIRE